MPHPDWWPFLLSQREAPRRLALFLALTFLITWGSWWPLAVLARRSVLAQGQPLFVSLLMLGGFGPTIASYLAVVATRDQAPLSEFQRRLFRWRVKLGWYLVALGLPFALALVGVGIAAVLDPAVLQRLTLAPWFHVLPLFLMMIVGGGLEELGWRGVAQPELERRMSRVRATLIVGVVWALWHLPLFSVPGVSQYGTSFFVFTVWVVGQAAVLAWLYGLTQSILLCVTLHSAANAAFAMGLHVPFQLGGPALAAATLNVAVGFGLVVASGRKVTVGA